MENECEALPGVAYPGVRVNRSTINTKTGYDDDDDYYSFEHNFGKYCPVLIILSVLQTENIYDQVYPKIYHHTSNLLVHYLVK